MTKGIVINKKGQLSIFMAISIVFFMTTVAFVINVGLFVKAKINLQNAVDAAAWSGAAVQSRQLTDIGYLNWEMRNNYKEWLFKYYVLGNLSVRGVSDPLSSSGQSNFRLQPFDPGLPGDKYNIPSICLDTHIQSNVCSFYSLPGIPRLSNIGFTGLDQVTKELENSIAQRVAENCTNSTNTNFTAASQWTYGLGENQENIDALPDVLLLTRAGAWTKGIELAFRIRNLEAIVNSPPESEVSISTITNIEQRRLAQDERVVKAFYSAYRNLGNGSDSLKNNLKITELSPRRLQERSANSLSNLLIPPASSDKYYLDLKFFPINMAIFFTTLIAKSSQGAQASCGVIKTALPVPSFPLGFDKNQNVLTYYAVKGETKFNGLFNPFSKDGIRLVAYAAAKPFGARIGPKLFNTYSNETFVTPRGVVGDQTSSKRSSSYIFGLNPTVNPDLEFPPIIPESADFWVQDVDEPIGGLTGAEDPKFVIPNLTYKKTGSPLNHDQSIYVMKTPIELADTEYKVGLYDPGQLAEFKSALTTNRPRLPEIIEAIRKIRAPTKYEAENYLIPTLDSDNARGNPRLDHYGQGSANQGLKVFAPLFGENALYTNDQLATMITQFFEAQKKSILAFKEKMYDIRETVLENAGPADQAQYSRAMDLFIDRRGTLTCGSIIGRLTNFLLGKGQDNSGVADSDTSCDKDGAEVTYVKELNDYFASKSNDEDFKNFYTEEYPLDSADNPMPVSEKFSSFFPGPNSGGSDNDGRIINPIRPNVQGGTRSLRNFYSTKLISVSHVMNRDTPVFIYKYSEGKGGGTAQGASGDTIENTLDENGQLDDLKIYQ